MKGERGQLLVGVILLLAVLAVIIPAMVTYVQNEGKWSVKQQQNSNAFQLAEAAVDRGYQKITESTGTWNNMQNGTQPAGYKFDNGYYDLSGGSYTVSITSGPKKQEVTIIGVGRDRYKKEARALQAVYSNANLQNAAIRSLSGVNISGVNVEVEWGSIISNQAIATAGRRHPQFYSAGDITPQDANLGDPPNTDSVQWWSYYAGIPPAPFVDFAFYKASAQATGTYYATTQNWGPTCGNATSCNTGNTYYIDGDLNLNSPGIFIGGTLIVRGNLNLPNGRTGQGAPTVPLPQSAWKQYGNDWAYYIGNNTQNACSIGWHDTTPGLPATFPGLNSTYQSDPTITITFSDNKLMVNGFMYVGGNLTAPGGGGQTKVAGVAFVAGNVNLSSNNFCVFYTDAAASSIVTTQIFLSRVSWRDVVLPWPSGAGP